MDTLERQASSILLREDRGAVAILTLNRPEKLNALSNALLAAKMDKLARVMVYIRWGGERGVRAIDMWY
jgi:hypothetical protein